MQLKTEDDLFQMLEVVADLMVDLAAVVAVRKDGGVEEWISMVVSFSVFLGWLICMHLSKTNYYLATYFLFYFLYYVNQ